MENIWTVADTFTFATMGFTSIADNDVDVDANFGVDVNADSDTEVEVEVEVGMMNAAVWVGRLIERRRVDGTSSFIIKILIPTAKIVYFYF